jgi:hypothetical protein
MESKTVLVVLDVGHARSRRWIACAQRVVSLLGTVWVAVDIGSIAKSGSPQRGPSGDKKKTRAWNKIDFMRRKIEVQKTALLYDDTKAAWFVSVIYHVCLLESNSTSCTFQH